MLEPIFQVSEFVELINQHLNLLGEVVIEGEISRIDIKNHRLIFASIKDANSSIDVFALTFAIRNFQELQVGMKVRVYGTPGLYKGSGKFRFQANQILPQGEGALQIAFERLKQRLELEGLFDPSHKRPLPLWPRNIGLVTAKNSSAYHDLVKIISARMSGLTLHHLPVIVQGNSSPSSLLKAFSYISAHHSQFDVIILARGGGSIEDLFAFNQEEIVRAVFACPVPVVSAIGHEDDWTLVDFAADMRASTPSNAAELVVQDKKQINSSVDSLLTQIKSIIQAKINLSSTRTSGLISTLKMRLRMNLNKGYLLLQSWQKTNQQFKWYVSHQQELTNMLVHRSTQKLNQHLELSSQAIIAHQRLLASYDIFHVLKRGFSITRHLQGGIITHTKQVKADDILQITLAHGQLQSIITSVKEESLKMISPSNQPLLNSKQLQKNLNNKRSI
jgi:exodeoxyribonuclease VII large subunit